ISVLEGSTIFLLLAGSLSERSGASFNPLYSLHMAGRFLTIGPYCLIKGPACCAVFNTFCVPDKNWLMDAGFVNVCMRDRFPIADCAGKDLSALAPCAAPV